jgi:hypothetical protein
MERDEAGTTSRQDHAWGEPRAVGAAFGRPLGDPEDDLRTHPQHHPKPGRPPAGPKQRPPVGGEEQEVDGDEKGRSDDAPCVNLPSFPATCRCVSSRRFPR